MNASAMYFSVIIASILVTRSKSGTATALAAAAKSAFCAQSIIMFGSREHTGPGCIC
jgi:hypothetical protein